MDKLTEIVAAAIGVMHRVEANHEEMYGLLRVMLEADSMGLTAKSLVYQKYAEMGMIYLPEGKLVVREDFEAAAPVAPPAKPEDPKPV